LDPPTKADDLLPYSVIYNGHAEGRPINSVFYKLNLKDLKIHNKFETIRSYIYITSSLWGKIIEINNVSVSLPNSSHFSGWSKKT
jgi:hypothetical protein